jgi:hypothetical protein
MGGEAVTPGRRRRANRSDWKIALALLGFAISNVKLLGRYAFVDVWRHAKTYASPYKFGHLLIRNIKLKNLHFPPED